MQLRELRERRRATLARARERGDAGLADLVVVEAELAQSRQRACGTVGRGLQRTRQGRETSVADIVPAESQREQGVQRTRRNLKHTRLQLGTQGFQPRAHRVAAARGTPPRPGPLVQGRSAGCARARAP
eukprot:scaffold92217_cov69-Phaeocystis_antarctica.AAC.3